jgi:hypothetical protein
VVGATQANWGYLLANVIVHGTMDMDLAQPSSQIINIIVVRRSSAPKINQTKKIAKRYMHDA